MNIGCSTIVTMLSLINKEFALENQTHPNKGKTMHPKSPSHSTSNDNKEITS